MFEFRAEDHSYWNDGKRMFGVTQTLAAVGISDFSGIPSAKREYYLARGRAVHLVAEQFVNGTFDPSYLDQLPADWRHPMLQIIDFLQSPDVEVLASEQLVHSVRLNAAGRLDLLVRFQGRLGLPDIKTSEAQASTAIQSAAYLSMLPSLGASGYPHANDPHVRFAIALPTDGSKWKTRFYDKVENLQDEAIWLSALAIVGWRHRVYGKLME